jgi:hypothetical protein
LKVNRVSLNNTIELEEKVKDIEVYKGNRVVVVWG